VFDDHVQVIILGELGQPPQAIGRQLLRLFERAFRLGVDADRMAIEVFGCFDPLVVILDRLGAGGRVGIAERPFAVAHDQERLDGVLVKRVRGSAFRVQQTIYPGFKASASSRAHSSRIEQEETEGTESNIGMRQRSRTRDPAFLCCLRYFLFNCPRWTGWRRDASCFLNALVLAVLWSSVYDEATRKDFG